MQVFIKITKVSLIGDGYNSLCICLLSKLQFHWYLSHQGNSLETKLIACSAGELGSVLVSGRSPGGGKGNPLQSSWSSLVAQMVKKPPANVGDLGSIPRSGRSPGGGHGYPLQYSCLENPMDRGPWWATVHGVSKIWTQLSD